MQQTSSNPSSSPQLSNSPSSTAIRRRRLRHRRHPPPSPAPSSTSPHSSSPNSITENQLNSSYSSPAASTSSAPSAPPIFLSAVVPLPVFRGLPGECPVAHLTLFSRLFPSPALPLVSRNFAVTLSDDAALWYELAVEPHAMSWDETKSAFLRAFRAPQFAETARSELVSLRQGDGESVNSYHLRMQWILKRWAGHGLPEPVVRGLFVDGLRDEFRDWVAMRKPETVGEAVGVAMDCEEARRGGETRCGFCEGRHWERECEARRGMKEEWMKRRAKEAEEKKVDRVVSFGSKCQCWKHQCWKKYERSASAATARNAEAGEAAAEVAGAVDGPVGGVSKAERVGGVIMAVGGFFLNVLVLCFQYL